MHNSGGATKATVSGRYFNRLNIYLNYFNALTGESSIIRSQPAYFTDCGL